MLPAFLSLSLPRSLSLSLTLPFFCPGWFLPSLSPAENSVRKKAVAMVIHPLALPGTFLATQWRGEGWGVWGD